MLSQRHTLYTPNAHHNRLEHPSQNVESVTNDPDGSVERDHFRDHLAQRAEPDALAMYVGCPSRLKLLGMHIGSLTPQGHDESFETTAHEDDLSR